MLVTSYFAVADISTYRDDVWDIGRPLALDSTCFKVRDGILFLIPPKSQVRKVGTIYHCYFDLKANTNTSSVKYSSTLLQEDWFFILSATNVFPPHMG